MSLVFVRRGSAQISDLLQTRKIIAMLREQFADESKANPILGQGGLLIVLDLHHLLACAQITRMSGV